MSNPVENQQISYISRLKQAYKNIDSSRVVTKKETDTDALSYFQQMCNNTLPKSESEAELRETIRNMFYADRTCFYRCVVKNEYLILLTEARSIVLHFHINNLVYVEWNGSQYVVRKNDIIQPTFINKKSKYDKSQKPIKVKRDDYQSLLERIAKLESNTLEKVEPADDREIEKTSPSEGSGKWSDEP